MENDEKSNDIYAIAARVKNLARGNDCTLTRMGDAMSNYYILVLKDLYDFAENLTEPKKGQLISLIRDKEDLPKKIISLNKKFNAKR